MAEPSVLSWVKQTLWKYRGQNLLIVGVTIIQAVADAVFPVAWQRLIDQANAGVLDSKIAMIFIALFAVRVVPIVYFLREKFLNRYEFDARFRLFKHLMRLSIPFHMDKQSTTVLLEAAKGISASRTLLRLLLRGDILADIPVAIFAFGYIAMHSVPACFVLLLFLALFLFLSYVLGSRIAKAEEDYNEMTNEVAVRERELMQHVATVKLHRAEQQEQGWFLSSGQQVLQLASRSLGYYTWFELIKGLSHVMPFAIVLIFFLPEAVSGNLTVGTLFALQLYSMYAVAPASFLGEMYQDIMANVAKIKPVLRILEQKPTVQEVVNPTEMKPIRHEICFKGISFQYPGAEKLALNDISLVIAAGEKVAIVGRTGSGKTTLARLLVRFYDPDHGLVTMDGTDLRQVSFESLYLQVCYVAQEIVVFTGTIGENVRYGLAECGEQRVRDACTNASADFAFKYSQGLETKVGEMGVKLSGGERQRLALARVFLRYPSVLILDEATAALDQMTERDVQAAFDRLLHMNGGTTMLVIAHRISTVRNADRIVVMDEGRIIDIGTHDELSIKCDLYQELCREMAK